MASSWMGMSTVLLEGVSRRWVRSGTFTRCQCLNGTYKMMRVRRKIVFHPSSIHPSGNRKEGRKEETHSRDVFPHFPRASERRSERGMRWRRAGESESPLRHKRAGARGGVRRRPAGMMAAAGHTSSWIKLS